MHVLPFLLDFLDLSKIYMYYICILATLTRYPLYASATRRTHKSVNMTCSDFAALSLSLFVPLLLQ